MPVSYFAWWLPVSNSVLTKTEGSLYKQVGRPPFTFMVLSATAPTSPLDSRPPSTSTSKRKPRSGQSPSLESL